MSTRILIGDCREVLRTLPDDSVHCCVTSPPYFRLRDYGVIGQLGLEETPEAYIAEMVAIFRDVRRTLRSDGTLWLNISDTYASSGGLGTGGNLDRINRSYQQRNVRQGRSGRACGISGKGKSDFSQHDSISIRLCGECRVDLMAGRSLRSGRSRAAAPSLSPSESSLAHTASACAHPAMSVTLGQSARTVDATQDLRLGSDPEASPLPGALGSATPQSSERQQGLCLPDEILDGVCQSCGRSLIDYVPLFVRMSDDISTRARGNEDNVLPPDQRQSRNQGINQSDSNHEAYGHYTTAYTKPKDLIGIPWMLAFALRADGWYLRQDIIWSKPSPMPESVTDRCTKAHEYLFLLSKSERYYYDAEAIMEGAVKGSAGSQFYTGKTGDHQLGRSSSKPRAADNKSHKYVTAYKAPDTEEHRTKADLMKVADVPWERRNRRSVWTIATQPFAEAHFATFPPALVEPCIRAGSPTGGTVLDPFGGSGTTGLVADRLGRDAVLIELNPAYAAMARRRIESDAGLFADVAD